MMPIISPLRRNKSQVCLRLFAVGRWTLNVGRFLLPKQKAPSTFTRFRNSSGNPNIPNVLGFHDSGWWNVLSSTRWLKTAALRPDLAPSTISQASSSGEDDPPTHRGGMRWLIRIQAV
jgi:hypothetical protein